MWAFFRRSYNRWKTLRRLKRAMLCGDPIEVIDDAPPERNACEEETVVPTHVVIDSPLNHQGAYFKALIGEPVSVRGHAPDGLLYGMVCSSGLPFDGWRPERLKAIE